MAGGGQRDGARRLLRPDRGRRRPVERRHRRAHHLDIGMEGIEKCIHKVKKAQT